MEMDSSISSYKLTIAFFFDSQVGRAFVSYFFNVKRARNFLKHLEYVGENCPDNVRCEYPGVVRKYYKYNKSTDTSAKPVFATESDRPFLETYYKSIGNTVRGFGLFSQTYLFH